MAAWKQPQRQRPRTKLPPVETSPDSPDSSFNSHNYPSISTPKVEDLALVSDSRTAFQFQHAKRLPARGHRAFTFGAAAQISGSASTRPGCHGLNARCSSRKKSAFVLPARFPLSVWQSKA